jgi:hypothetical protein
MVDLFKASARQIAGDDPVAFVQQQARSGFLRLLFRRLIQAPHKAPIKRPLKAPIKAPMQRPLKVLRLAYATLHRLLRLVLRGLLRSYISVVALELVANSN